MLKFNPSLPTLCVVFYSLIAGPALAESPPSPASNTGPEPRLEIRDDPLSLVPLVTLRPGDSRILSFVLRNETQGPIRYFKGARHGLAWLDMQLIAVDGTNVPYCEVEDWWVDPKDLLVLERGEAIPIQVDLNAFGMKEVFGNIPPGRYTLRAVSDGIAQYGATSLKIDRTIMILDIVDGRGVGAAWLWFAAIASAGAIAWACIAYRRRRATAAERCLRHTPEAGT